jgi:5-formyltetrahydrofolate cyclo-ligase
MGTKVKDTGSKSTAGAKHVRLTKRLLRSKILLLLKKQKEEDRTRRSRQIQGKLLRSKAFQKAKTVMFYIALNGEVDTGRMIEIARKSGKKVAVPVCRKKALTIKPCILDGHGGLIRGPYGVIEPAVKMPARLEELGLVIVPGLAFDRNGNRLGRGKGYYDRFLKLLPKDTPSVGLAFDFQILPVVPTAPHDVSVHRVISA